MKPLKTEYVVADIGPGPSDHSTKFVRWSLVSVYGNADLNRMWLYPAKLMSCRVEVSNLEEYDRIEADPQAPHATDFEYYI